MNNASKNQRTAPIWAAKIYGWSMIASSIFASCHSALAATVVFGGETQACAGGVADALHTFQITARIFDDEARPMKGQVLRFDHLGTDPNGPRFVLPNRTLGATHFVTSSADGRMSLAMRSGKHAGLFRIAVRLGKYAPGKVLCERELLVAGTEFMSGFLSHAKIVQTFKVRDGRDEGSLDGNNPQKVRISLHKLHLECRLNARRGDLVGNWSVVNNHRVLVRIASVTFSLSHPSDGKDIVITAPRRIAHFCRLDDASPHDPTLLNVVTHQDGSALVRVRQINYTAIPKSWGERTISYQLTYIDESQQVDLTPDISLDFHQSLPQSPAKARFFAPPTGVAGILAWTVAGYANSQPLPADAGLYVARIGADARAASHPGQQHFSFPIRIRDYDDQEYQPSLVIAPGGQKLLVNAYPEDQPLIDGPEGSSVGVDSVYEVDLTSGKYHELLAGKGQQFGFRWSPDTLHLAYYTTTWRWPWEREGLGLSFEINHPLVSVDLQTGKASGTESEFRLPKLSWTSDNHLQRRRPVWLPKLPQRSRTPKSKSGKDEPKVWRDEMSNPQSSDDGRQLAFLSNEQPPIFLYGEVYNENYFRKVFLKHTALWAQPDGMAPFRLTRIDDYVTPQLLWSRDGQRMAAFIIDDDNFFFDWQLQRVADVTLWNWRAGTIRDVFQLHGRWMSKVPGNPGSAVKERITPLDFSSDGRFLFVRYDESVPTGAPRDETGKLSQALFAIDLQTKRAHLLATFTGVAEIAWRAK